MQCEELKKVAACPSPETIAHAATWSVSNDSVKSKVCACVALGGLGEEVLHTSARM